MASYYDYLFHTLSRVDFTADVDLIVNPNQNPQYRTLSQDEMRDHLNKGWSNVVQLYENKSYKLIQQRWGTSKISNPNKNLSILCYKSGYVPYGDLCYNDDDDDSEPAAKRARREPCTFMLDKLIAELTSKLAFLRQGCLEKKKEKLAALQVSQKMELTNPGNGNRNRRNMMSQHSRKCREFEQNFSRKINRYLQPLENRIFTLRNIREDTERFHQFYSEVSQDDDSALYLNQNEVDDLLLVEDAIANYRTFYMKK